MWRQKSFRVLLHSQLCVTLGTEYLFIPILDDVLEVNVSGDQNTVVALLLGFAPHCFM